MYHDNDGIPIVYNNLENDYLGNYIETDETGINWSELCLETSSFIFDNLEEFRKIDPRFNFVTNILYNNYYHYNNYKIDENVFEFADIISSEISSKYEKINKKIIEKYSSIENFTKSKEFKYASCFFNDYNNFIDRNIIYRSVLYSIHIHNC